MKLSRLLPLALLIPTTSYALVGDWMFSGYFGTARPTVGGQSYRADYGGGLSYRLLDTIALGVDVTTNGGSSDTLSLRDTQIVAHLTLYPFWQGFFVGGRIGPVIESVSGTGEAIVTTTSGGTTTTSTATIAVDSHNVGIATGLSVGYDFSLAPTLTVGPQANWTYTSSLPQNHSIIEFLAAARLAL